MAKTYILEPAAYRYEKDDRNNLAFDDPEFAPETDFTGSTIEVDGYPFKVIYAGDNIFTEDGVLPASPMDWPSVFAQILADNEATLIVLHSDSLPSDDSGTLTLSIYTGEDDTSGIPGLEDKNVVYEYQLVANNNIKDILMAVMDRNGADVVNIPGYSVMELLVENLLVFHNITDEKLATFRATTFANDVEKIAWIIRNSGNLA